MFNEVNEPLYSRSQLETKAHDLDLNRFLRKTGMPGIGFSLGCRSREYPSSKQIFPDDQWRQSGLKTGGAHIK